MTALGGTSLKEDPDTATVDGVWKRYHELQDALVAAGREAGTTQGVPDNRACQRIVHELCFVQTRDIRVHPVNREEIGNLRCGLNAVHKLLWVS